MKLQRVMGEVGRLLAEGHNTNPDPLQGLLEELAGSGSMVYVLQQQVAELDTGPGGLYETNVFGNSAPHVLVKMLGEWSDRRARQAKAAIEAGLSERMVTLAERQGEMVARMVNAVLGSPELELSEDQMALGRLLMAQQLRELGMPD